LCRNCRNCNTRFTHRTDRLFLLICHRIPPRG
jgi:hypothetical protein